MERIGVMTTRLGAALAMLAIASTLLAAMPRVARAQTASPEQQLVDRFVPIAELRTQSAPCDGAGEGYFPAPVDVVLGNPQIALKLHLKGKPSDQDPVIKVGPTARDLWGLSGDFYLDFPGDPRHAGCQYETDFKRFAAEDGAKPTVYAHIVIDKAAAKLIVQYWFWWYFNDWNNTHESDWEMIQLVFNATSVEEALRQTPVLAGYASHNGGETAKWGSAKLQREGDHPLVYPAAGSHAIYFGQHQYIGWGENGSGFGCDNTTAPSTRTPLAAVLVPDAPTRDSPLAWVTFRGNWGERLPWTFNGPTGPANSLLWRDPMEGMELWRPSSLYVPSSGSLGPTATGFFCTVSKYGSQLLIRFGTQPRLLAGGILATFLAIVLLFLSLRRQLEAAIGLYCRHLRVFLFIGVWVVPIGVLFNGLTVLVQRVPPADWLMKWFNDTAGARLFAAGTVGLAQQAGMAIVIAPPVLQAMKEILAGRAPTVRDSFEAGYRRWGPLALGLAVLYAAVGVLTLALIGIPIAIWLAVRWQFFAQAIVIDGAGNSLDAIRASARSVRGRWFRTLASTLVFQAFGVLPGPIIGALLLVLGKTGVQFSNALSSVVYAITVPIALIGLTLVYEQFKPANLRS